MSRILVVEDEAHLAQGLRFNLEAEGHSVEVVGDGESALELLLHQVKPASPAGAPAGEDAGNLEGDGFDAMVLDVMLPGIDGFSVASELRSAKQFIPVLMLTARGRPEDVLKGFASGADDYLPKPFELPILLARLQGLLRRRQWMTQGQISAATLNSRNPSRGKPDAAEAVRPEDPQAEVTEYSVYSFAGRTVDFGKLELRVKENSIQLTLMEAEFLRYLIRNAGSPVSRKSILEEVWGLREDTDTRAIDNFIVRLRRYIETDPANPEHLLTVRGVGYRFVREPSKS
jgi:DNA-binding response OmpR family regulator